MMTSRSQVARLLSLVPYLQSHDGVTLDQAAADFGVTPRQLRKDLDVLWMCGLPGGLTDDLIDFDMDAVDGQRVIHISNAGFLTKPLRFTQHEAVSLLVALNAIGGMTAGALQDAAAGAAGKLSAASGHDDPVLLAINTGDDALRSALLDAIEAGQRLRLTYDGAARGETTTPVVDPGAIQMRDGAAYLQAWSLERDGWRTYRLDRIVEAVPTGERTGDHGVVPGLPEGWFDTSGGRVTLELGPACSWVVDYYPVSDVQACDDGGLRATFPVADPAWLTSLLLRLGDGARVIDPTDAADEAVRAAREAVALAEEVFGAAG
ncbi:WYL domain-containing protein [Brooklawnia cerclae]|uniref:Proteasome accessory factor C n=1 Tax=Brooklawnia cerclae TaxID=349934 RepID=A0ABX0SCM5_9ACTN|nr:WYL domain-containing protein [Brooklawnia cerclae]NIH56142.1 proteasome accessory factor C [Brooklawnia cerclae]